MRLLARKCTFPLAVLGLLGLITTLVWWVNVSPANAQVPTHVFKGKVVLDGRPAPDGTLVVAIIDDNKRNKVGEVRTTRGTFLLSVRQPSGQVLLRKTVNFWGETPDGGRQFPFPQSARWLPGGETTIALEVVGVFRPVRQLPPPAAAFSGKVIFDGRPVEDGTQVAAHIDGVRISGTIVTRGSFRLVVPQQPGQAFAGKTVEFRSVVLRRRISWPQTAVWKQGQISINLQAGTAVKGQQPPTAAFSGKVIFEGSPVEDGTQVTAYIDGVRISGTVVSRGSFGLEVPQQSGKSYAGKAVEFRSTVQGRRISWPQTAVWKPGEISITLEAGVRQEQQPTVHVFEGKAILDGQPAEDGTTVNAFVDDVRISSTRTTGGRFRLVVAQPPGQSFSGRTVEFRGRTAQDRRLDWLQSAVWRGGETSITLGPNVRYPSGEPGSGQSQVDRDRQEEQLRIERDRLEQDRRLQEERARLEQTKVAQEKELAEQEFARREEILRRELAKRNSVDPGQPPPTPDGPPPKRGRTRGFFTNSQVGQLGNVNTSVDPTMLAIIGILFTLGATTLQLFRGN